MKIKSLEVRDVRCFRGKRKWNLTNPNTDKPLDRVVFIGSNGSGKTTILELIHILFQLVDNTAGRHPILDEIGFASLKLEVPPSEIMEDALPKSNEEGPPKEIEIVFCHEQYKEFSGSRYLGDRIVTAASKSKTGWTGDVSPLGFEFKRVVDAMRSGKRTPGGGIIYFPNDRRLMVAKGARPIQPPPEGRERQWTYKYSNNSPVELSLEQYWVWLNYLDLEENASGDKGNHLPPAVEVLEEILGHDRRVSIKKGRVLIDTHWSEKRGLPKKQVHLDQLPSGEQQCALLLGEIVRLGRRGAILLIDEPEISLHAALQRKFLDQLKRISKPFDLQIVLATHSQEIARSVNPEELISLDYQKARPDTKQDEETR